MAEEFKRKMSNIVRRKLIEIERLSRSIKQWYERVINLSHHHKRKSKKEEEGLKGKEEEKGNI